MTLKVIVSSTSLDMGRDYRPAVRDVILRLPDAQLVAMEYFGSHDESGQVFSVSEVAKADVYVGLIGWRYGFVAAGQTKSVTEMEYQEAARLGKHIRIYLTDESPGKRDAVMGTFPPGSLDTAGDTIDARMARDRLAAFRDHLKHSHTCTYFDSPGDLAARVSTDLHSALTGGAQGDALLLRGRQALMRGDYVAASKELQSAVDTLYENAQPGQAAQARYLLALASLGGRRPFRQTLPVMRATEQLVRAAIDLNECPSYLIALALFKFDFARNGLPALRDEAQTLVARASVLPKTPRDAENLEVLAQCLPALASDYLGN